MRSFRKQHFPNLFTKRIFFLFFLLILVPFNPPNTLSAQEEAPEYIIKAGYIYNFTKFVLWPEKVKREIDNSGMRLCLVGEDPFGNILDRVANRFKRKNKDLAVKREVALGEIPHCHILFVSPSEKHNINKILLSAKGFPVLVIGDSPGFGQLGVGINFFNQSNNVRFEINPEALNKAGLWVDSALLEIARIVGNREM